MSITGSMSRCQQVTLPACGLSSSADGSAYPLGTCHSSLDPLTTREDVGLGEVFVGKRYPGWTYEVLDPASNNCSTEPSQHQHIRLVSPTARNGFTKI